MPDAVKTERLAELQALLNRQTRDFDRSIIGRTVDVLIEKPARYPGQLVGRSPWLQPVHVMGPAAWIGRIVPLTIVGHESFSLFGEPVSTNGANGPMMVAEAG